MNREPIAIIGIGCRFPKANSPEAFWHLLRDGVDAITEMPPSRWDLNPDTEQLDKTNTRWGGFLEQVDQFDPKFFGISSREAGNIDPQQRLLLEVTWEALEDAGQIPKHLAGTQTGVFIGISTQDFSVLTWNNSGQDIYMTTGTSHSIAANRISYVFNFTGPSVAFDTACSSSLVAVHYACLSLWNQESTLAVAGGVNALLLPKVTANFAKAGFLAPDGRCKTFDARADGYVRGEGAGAVILKPLSQALASGDRIYAVIKGSAVNQDGRSNGLTAPNPQAQSAVLRSAYQLSGISPGQIQYIEAHGTGTSLGDPIEMNALGEVLSQDRPLGNYCAVGSVKTNIGHLEAAAGIAGLIKVALSLKHRQIPPSLHFQKPNPYIPFDKLPLRVQQTLSLWPQGNDLAVAGVSSFGFGGTNAHVVLAKAPNEGQKSKVKSQKKEAIERPLQLLTLSGKSENALRELAQRYQEFLINQPEEALKDICFTANTGRTHFDYRLAVVAESTVQLQKELSVFTANQDTTTVVSGQVKSKKRPLVAFLFTGQGSQYIGMGRQLYETAPIFRQTLDRCDEILRSSLGKSLLTVLYPEPGKTSPLDQTAYTQPALFAIEYALSELWKSWGIVPTAVMGHSLGEYVAACVAGVFSLEDGLKLIVERSRLIQSLPPEGEMAVVFAAKETIRGITEINNEKVAFAAFNAPQNTVISGERQTVLSICTALEAEGIKTKKLQVSHAFHSPMMEPMLAEFHQIAASITYAAPQIDLISNLTAERLMLEDITPEYWVRHLRSCVRFADSLKILQADGYEMFVEIGPKPTLLGMGRNCLPEEVGVWLPSLRQGQDDWQLLLQSLGKLYTCGVGVDWSGFDKDYRRQQVSLPTYPWQRQRYWTPEAEPLQQVTVHSQKQTQNQILNQLHEQPHSTAISSKSVDSKELVKYYKSLSIKESSVHSVGEISNLRFAPFEETVPGFSWLLAMGVPEQHREHLNLVKKAQQEMKSVLFRGLDFSSINKVVDIGCGYALDLMMLGQEYPHLYLHGCNISPDQIKIGNERIRECGLENRINLYELDSSKNEFPDQYDLAIGFQVIHHIQEKQGVFSNLGRHLKNGGMLILAEIVSNLNETIAHPESSAYFISKNEWAKLLARHHLRIVECVDASHEIGNFLFDPNFDQNLSQFAQDADVITKAHLEGPHFLGQLLRKELVLYCLFTVQKDNHLLQETIQRVNQDKLAALVPYSQIIDRSEGRAIPRLYHDGETNSINRPDGIARKNHLNRQILFSSEPQKRQILLESYLCEQVTRVLQLPASQLNPEQQLNHLGLDSLMGFELKKSLESDLQIDLPVVKLLEGVSIRDMTKILLCQITEADSTSSKSIFTATASSQYKQKADQIDLSQQLQKNPEQILAKLDRLTDEEVDALLNNVIQG